MLQFRVPKKFFTAIFPENFDFFPELQGIAYICSIFFYEFFEVFSTKYIKMPGNFIKP